MTYNTVLTILFLFVTAVAAYFNETPASQAVVANSNAVFRCQHPTADVIGWTVNNTSIAANPSPDITPTTIRDEDNNLINILTIIARPQYNGTTIVCVAVFFSGTPSETTAPVMLLVQGNSNNTTTTPGFTEGPYSMNVTAGAIVNFGCVHQSFDVEWEINGMILGGEHFPPGVSVAKLSLAGGFRHVLTVNANQEYDNTTFACVLEDDPSIRSEVAVLRVQGPLDAPSHLNSSRDDTTNTTTITWTPPPSIDLTNVTIDIVYCIEVQNITCGERGDVIVSECDITEPIYQSRDIPLNYIYNITVTPMSNVEGALNGTLAYMEEEFPILSQMTSISLRGDGEVNVSVTMDITDHLNKPLPSTCSLSLAGMNTNNPTLNSTVETRRDDSIVLDLVGGLKVEELLDCIVVAYTCADHPLTMEAVLSTHFVQDISFPRSNPGEIIVTGDFLNSSTTTGLLVIAYTSSSNVRYHLYSRTPNEQDFRTVINNLEGGDYHVSVFTVENGLPSREAATLPQRVSVTSTENMKIQPTLVYMLQSTSTGVCITCTFLESSTATDCVAVVHQRISQLNSSAGLMNIESSHKFTRSGNTASGCIEGVNLDNRQVGVLQGVLEPGVTANSLSTTTVAVSLVTVAIVTAIIAVLLVVVIYMKRNWRKSKLERALDVEVVSMNSYTSVSAIPRCVVSDGEDNTATESAPPSYDSISTPTNDRSTEEDEGYAKDATYSVPQRRADIKHEKVNGDEYALVNKPVKATETSTDDTAQGRLIYAKPDVKPQDVSVPLDDDRVEYVEINKTEGAKGQQYEMVSHPTSKPPIMVVDDTSKPEFGYSEIRLQQNGSTENSEDKPKPVTTVSFQAEVLLPGEAQQEMVMVVKGVHKSDSAYTSSSVADEEKDGLKLPAPVQQASTDLAHQAVFVHNSSNNPTPPRRPSADSKPLSHLEHKEVEDATDRTHGWTKIKNGGILCQIRWFVELPSKVPSFEVKDEKVSDIPADENKLVTLSSSVCICRSQPVLQGRLHNIQGMKKLFKANTTEHNEDASKKAVLAEDQSQDHMNKHDKRCFERSLDTVRKMPVMIAR